MFYNITAKETSNREVKSSAFTALFSDPKNAAALYQALEPGEEVKPEDIDYTTLSGVLFMARKNDMAFTVKKRVLVISEHQSTVNENMPLRDVIYFGRTIEKLVEPKALYKTRLIPIPVPEFYVFYNGTAPFAAEKELRLSDAYLVKDGEPMLELKVKVININLSADHPILKQCRPIYEYSSFIQKIRDCMKNGKTRDEAIIQAISDCEDEGLLVEFLREHGTEASNMLFTEFNMEDALEVRGEEKFEEGMEKGIEQGKELGRSTGIQVLVQAFKKLGRSREEAQKELEESYALSQDEAEKYLVRFWQ